MNPCALLARRPRRTTTEPAGVIRHGRVHDQIIGPFLSCTACGLRESHPDAESARFNAHIHNGLDHDGELEVVDDTTDRRRAVDTTALMARPGGAVAAAAGS